MRIIETICGQDYQYIEDWINDHGTTAFGARKAVRALVILRLGYFAGLRVSEMAGLTWGNLGTEPEYSTAIDIPGTLGKYGIHRTIPLSTSLRKILMDWWTITDAIHHGTRTMPIVCNTANGECLSTRQIRRICSKCGELSIRRPFHPHVLRHSFATRLSRNTELRVVQQLLGHKHLSSTECYLHPGDDDRRAAIAAIDQPTQ